MCSAFAKCDVANLMSATKSASKNRGAFKLHNIKGNLVFGQAVFADIDLKQAFFNEIFTLAVVEAEVLEAKLKLDLCGLALFDKHLFVALELTDRTHY